MFISFITILILVISYFVWKKIHCSDNNSFYDDPSDDSDLYILNDN